jgi:uncharacterized protein (TIGR00730 family)
VAPVTRIIFSNFEFNFKNTERKQYFCINFTETVYLVEISMQTICVYCAASTKIKPEYFEATARLGRIFTEANLSVVFGGGSSGLMGKLADSVLTANGKITGIIPQFMCDEEWHHKSLTDLIVVETMHERKALMAQMADAIVALPGGCGTMEELLEAITWKQLGILSVPIVIVNMDGYYNSLIDMLERAVEENFMRDVHKKMWEVVNTPEQVLSAISNSTEWESNARTFAAI